MIKTVKCVTRGCEFEGRVVTAEYYYVNRIASLDGPFFCQKCGNPMKIVARIPINKGKAGKTMAPTSSARATVHKVVKKKKKPALTLKGYSIGNPKRKSKPVAKRSGVRKRGPGK